MVHLFTVRFFGLRARFPHCRRLAAAIGVVLVSALLGACGADGNAAAPTGARPAMPVTVIEAQPQTIPVIIEAVGQLEGSKGIEVRARVSGILERQRYREGEFVKAGTTLFTIDREPYEIALAQAQASLAQNKASLVKARREVARLKPLLAQNTVSQRDFDDADTAVQTAEAEVMVSEAKVREAELNLSYTNVNAPISGVTGSAQYSVGSLISAGGTTSLLTTMNSVDPIWVRFSFSEMETQKLRRAGDNTSVKLELPDGSLYAHPGRLNFAASTVDRNTGAVAQRAEFPNPGMTLLPGQFVRVRVHIGEREAYRVPQAALAQTDRGKMVFTVSADNTVAPRPVVTDGWAGHDWVVTEGLQPGDKVIIDNLMKLRPGAPVAPHAQGEAPAQGNAQGGSQAKAEPAH